MGGLERQAEGFAMQGAFNRVLRVAQPCPHLQLIVGIVLKRHKHGSMYTLEVVARGVAYHDCASHVHCWSQPRMVNLVGMLALLMV